LANNEKIVYRATLHWWIYARGILLFILGIIIGEAAGGKGGGATAGGFISFIGILSVISAFMRARSSEFVVTNRKVILKTGVLKRKLVELQLNRAEGLKVDQGILGRMLDYGSLVVTSGSVTESFSPIAKPYEFKKQINNAIEGSFSMVQNNVTI
jgi:uncharacterized membrane protein YdbT with pleckstrin-like domain